MESMSVTLPVSNFERSMDSRDEQPANMESMLVTNVVSNEEGNAIEVSDEQPENNPDMSVALDVSNCEISMLFSDEHPAKIPDTLRSDFMVREAGSLSDSRDEQPENMPPTASACPISNEDKSSEVSEEQPSNIPESLEPASRPKHRTCEVSKPDRSSVDSDEHS